ncbi:MAG: Flp pilus assembly complex ATPase component TadA [Deltaproteobacteria bacterium]|nr:Flp pilus assembly complex ATPase component TadA [Deltaproteobacteria bacterium]
MSIESRIREAEVYHSMGFLKETLNIYEDILSNSPRLSPSDMEIIKEKIHLLTEEMENSTKSHARDITPEDISIIKEAVSIRGTVPEILDSASALKELGLIEEAIAEYGKLFHLDYPPERIIPELTECLFKIYPPFKVIEHIENFTKEHNLSDQDRARIKFMLGLEMEKRDNKDLALELYRSAENMDPANVEIKDRLSSLVGSLVSGSRYDYLITKKMVTAEQLQKALAISKKTRKSVEFVLIDHFKVNKEEVGKSLSLFYNCPFKSFDPGTPIPVELIRNMKKSFLLHDLWVPLSWSKDGVEILLDDPRDLTKTDQISSLMKTKKIIIFVGIKEDIEQFITHFFDTKPEEAVEDMIEELDMIPDVSFEEEGVEEDQEEEGVDESSGTVVRLVDQILVAAYRKNASDIHIEPSPVTKKTGIRFRMDGVCQEYLQAPNSMAKGILSRIKIMAGLDIAERRLPQDGKIKFRRKGVPPFELRVATLPTTGGYEDAVLRILAKAGAMKLEEMGLSERNLRIMKKIISQPYGLILVVGPTGSGKTTTLHSALGYINKPSVKIWTAEDPVEITQPGLRQVEAKPRIGLDFARIMRAFLRADPDVIMIGEMRDQETASIGIEASLTGHLVFSTLHTNSAPETVTRLLDMELNPLNFSDAFLGVLAQRLTRRLCKNCRKEYHPSTEEFEEIVAEYGREKFKATNIEYTPELTLYRPVGCETCSGTGYKGRMGIHELMEGTPEIKRLIKKQASSEDLFTQAEKDGMTTLKQDGIQKVFQGLTDINEVRRVCID